MKVATPKIVHHGKQRIFYGVLIVAVLMVVAAWAGFDYGRQHSLSHEAVERENVEIRRQLEAMDLERGRLRERLAAQQRASQIDREATKLMREELRQSQDDRTALEQELALLRGIVSNGAIQKGLYIQGFALMRGEREGVFRFRFTVGQAFKNVKSAKGTIHVTVEGEQAGQDIKLGLKELSGGKVEVLKMGFRHFQDVEGLFELPEGFEPRNVVVEIKPKGKRLSPVEKHFVWLVAG